MDLRTLPPGGIGPIVPGFYQMTASEYHADPCPMPSLSSSVAKILINKNARRAKGKHPRLGVPDKKKSTPSMDLGTVAHELLLGKGGGFVVLEFDDYKKKEAQQQRDAVIANGKTPVLMHQLNQADMICEAVQALLAATPGAELIFKAGEGQAEVVAIWQEDDGTWCRAMLDWISNDLTEIADLKVTGVDFESYEVSTALGTHISKMHYEISEAFYMRGFLHLLPELAGRMKFRFVFAEDEEPYEVAVVENDGSARETGRRKVEYAIRKWGECIRAADWPGLPRKILTADYPAWAYAAWMKREVEDDTFV